MPADPARRFLVAAGTEHYLDSDELASVPEDLRKMIGFFSGLGYREQLPEVRLDPSSSALRRALSGWLNGNDREASDTAVIYYSGHGDNHAGHFYLLTADSEENLYADTALRADYVLEALGEGLKVRRLLLILDACYAGQGAFDASRIAATMSPWQNFGDGEGVWVVAAAGPKQEAQERLFADAFVEAARQLQRTTGTLQPYIGLDSLLEQINGILKSHGRQQRATYIPVTQATGLAPFIPNARYEPDALPNVDLETRDWLRRHAAQLAEHWAAKARGVEVAAQAGWYFTGRRAALTELSSWLADPGADTRLRVVTGDPGSGKSAVLGLLVTLADTSAVLKPPGTPADPGAIPPADSITAALLARGKAPAELLADLAASLGIAPSAELAVVLSKRPVVTVVIDALDEAADPAAVIERVISPLQGAALPGRGPRLLVATRRNEHLLGSLPAARVTVDLDQDTYRRDTDTAEYVEKVLLAADDPESPTPYRDQPDLARSVATQVRAIAGHSFLIAQIAARTLARTPRALDPAEVSGDRERWRDVGAAFDRDLDRYGENAHRVRGVLTPLAWAEGAGLPRELWAPLATALADDQSYQDEDITWLADQAGFYLVEALEKDRSVYRLYHEQFAEHLRAARPPSTAHQRITAELLRHVPVAAEGRREWAAAAPYIRTHFATHAAKAGMLDRLVNDPGFLLAADSARLLPALHAVVDPEARRSASAYESTHYLLPGQPVGQAAAQLDLAAHIYGATRLADGIDRLPYQRPWTIAWGHWARPDRHTVLGRHAGRVQAVATTTIDGIPAAVTGGRDGTVRVWDLRTRAARGEPLHGHAGGVKAAAAGEVDGTPIAVTGGFDGTVRMWNLRTGAPRGKPLLPGGAFRRLLYNLRRPELTTRLVAAGEVDGTLMAVTGSFDGTMQVWDLRTGAPRGKPLLPEGAFRRLRINLREPELATRTVAAAGEAGGTPVVVTGGSRGLRVWDLRTAAARGRWLLPQGVFRGFLVRLHAYVWAVLAVAVGEVDGTPVAVTGGPDGTVQVWDLRTRTALGEPLHGHAGAVEAVAVGEVDGTPVAVTGGHDGTVRMWDLRTAVHDEALHGHASTVEAVAVGEVDGTPAVVTGSRDGTVRMWDLHTGAARGEPLHGGGAVQAVAIGEVDGTPAAVTGGFDGTVWVWNLSTGAAAGMQLPPSGVTGYLVLARRLWQDEKRARISPPVWAVATAEVDGTPIAVTGGFDGTMWVWDLRTGIPHGKPLVPGGTLRLQQYFRRQDMTVRAVATGEVDGTPVAVTGGPDGIVRVWDLRTRTALGEPLHGHVGAVEAVALGEVDGTPVAVTGDNNGTISMWTIGRDQRALARLDAPSGITAIIFADHVGWLTSTEDGSLFIWRPSPTPGHGFPRS